MHTHAHVAVELLPGLSLITALTTGVYLSIRCAFSLRVHAEISASTASLSQWYTLQFMCLFLYINEVKNKILVSFSGRNSDSGRNSLTYLVLSFYP